jgi:hypothetical protein
MSLSGKGTLAGMKYAGLSPFHWTITNDDQICDGIFAHSIGGDSATGTFTTMIYKELIPPQSRKQRWVRKWEDLGMAIMDFSFWAHRDLQVLVEPRENK